jgi:hypothetical protein
MLIYVVIMSMPVIPMKIGTFTIYTMPQNAIRQFLQCHVGNILEFRIVFHCADSQQGNLHPHCFPSPFFVLLRS